ncbi:hypothetical protein KR059_004627 [Drosophila kikkawai]|nr:hypothetical protein KR059_004627 [Drosophila kikkawai]
MHSFTTFFRWALFACILCQGSFAEDQSGYICLIDDPKQNQCDSFCLTELSPRLSKVVKAQNQGNSKLETLEVKVGEVQMRGQLRIVENRLNGRLQGVESKLESKLQEVQTKLEAKLEKSLHEVNTKLEGQLQGLQEGQTKLDAHQTKMEAKIEDSQLAVKTKLEGQLQGVENNLEGHLQEVQTKLEAKLIAVKSTLDGQQVELNKMEDSQAKLKESLLATAAPQQVPKVVVPASDNNTIPPDFELFGNRYFRIVNEIWKWEIAERRCREMGGYLASFQNEEELNAIKPKLGIYDYWLGINDRDKEGHFVSVASHKSAPFLKWREGEPNDRNHEENCIILSGGKMWDGGCDFVYFRFICQADNET